MQFCYQCGAQAETDDQFCGNCGIAQPVAAPPPAAEKNEHNAPLTISAPPAPAPEKQHTVELIDSQSPPPPRSRDLIALDAHQSAPLQTGANDFALVGEPAASSSAIDKFDDQGAAIANGDKEPSSVPLPNASSPLMTEPPSASLEAARSGGGPVLGAAGTAGTTGAVNGGAAASAGEGIAAAPAFHDETDPELQATIISRPPTRVVENSVAPPPEDNQARQINSERMSGNASGGGNSSASVGRSPRRTATSSGSGGERRVAPKNLEAGTVLNSRYEIVRRVGGGGMGAVYLAKDRNLGDAPRAVKEMIQSQMDETQQEKAIGDFKRESLLLTSLEHSSIPTIYDYFYDDDACRFYLVMRYISGGDLLTRLRNAPGTRIDEKTATAWGAEVADVLEYLHSRRPPIIYRDLKPANLMIDGNSGRIMLIDFGIARWVGTQEKGVTAVGTMGYAPPELFSGKVEARSDVYSLGATMFHLLTGADPQDNPLLIFDFAKHPRPRLINPGLTNEIERILMRAVEYKPEDRFASAGELRDALAQHLKDLSTGNVTYGDSGAHVATTSPDHVSGQIAGAEMVFCGFCGGRIAATDLFCAYCGSRQPLVGANAALQRPSRSTAKLVVASTTELNNAFALPKDSNLVGRSDPNSNLFPEVDLTRFDPNTKISRRHARIWREGDVFLVEDLGSINGTVLNDSVRLAPRQARSLSSGDKLRLGETTLHFLVG